MQSLCMFLQKNLQMIQNKMQKNEMQPKKSMMPVAGICMAVILAIVAVSYFHMPQIVEAYAVAADFAKEQAEGRRATAEDTLPVHPETAELIHDKLATDMQIELIEEAPEPEIMADVIEATTSSISVIETKEENMESALQTSSNTSNKKKQSEKIPSSKKKKSEKTPKIKLSDQDKKVLLRIVEAEATGEDIKGKMLVANVVLNRVSDEEFPDNVTDVVFQNANGKYQFSPISDGRYWDVTISEESEEAVERVLNGEDSSQGALYFMAREYSDPENVKWFDRDLTRLFRYGVHEFFK